MLSKLQHLRQEYPSQFWLLLWGMLISTVGASMIWPFLMIYVSERLHLPLASIAILMTVNAAFSLVFSFISGPIIDRVGRKGVMVISLAVNGLVYILMSQAETLPAFVVLMALGGAFNPLYRIGADAMMADLIPPEKRPDAYSLLRMGNNVGVALGPSIGGLVATLSYTVAFYFAAAGMLAYGLLVAVRARETLPKQTEKTRVVEKFGGYGKILRDRPFMSFIGVFTLTQMAAAIMWVLLSVYAKQNFGVPESQYGLIPTTNAVMVVLFQLAVTRMVKNRPPLVVLSGGALIYALGVGSVALGYGFWGFWTSMVIFTVGELILTPTATTLAANLAPADMRGRYMGLYGLTWYMAAGIGPYVGGMLNDHVSPVSIWYGGMVVGLLSAGLFLVIGKQIPAKALARSSESP
jgi:MFS family permease